MLGLSDKRTADAVKGANIICKFV